MKKILSFTDFISMMMGVAVVVLITSCKSSDYKKEVGFTLNQSTIEVPAEENTAQIGYSLTNPIVGVEIKLVCNEKWLNGFDVSKQGVISFHVDKNPDNRIRETKVEAAYGSNKKQVFTVKQAAGKSDFEISYDVKNMEITMNVTPAFKDSVYLFSMYPRQKVPSDTDVIKEIRKDIDYLLNIAKQTGINVQDALNEFTAKNQGMRKFGSLKEDTEYVGFALYINNKTGEFFSDPVIKSVKTGKVTPSENKLSIEISDIKPRSVVVHFKTTNEDRYAIAFFNWNKWKSFSDEEILKTLTMPTYAQYLRIYEGDKDLLLPNLSPDTEYAVVAFGYLGGVVTTSLVKKLFTTDKKKVANILFNLLYDKYYDGTELSKAYPNDFAGAEGKAVLPVKVKITGEAVKYYYGLYSEDFTDPSSHSDEDFVNELLYYGVSDEQSAFFVPYETVCTAVGYAVDKEGDCSHVYRERIYLSKEGVSPISDFKKICIRVYKAIKNKFR